MMSREDRIAALLEEMKFLFVHQGFEKFAELHIDLLMRVEALERLFKQDGNSADRTTS